VSHLHSIGPSNTADVAAFVTDFNKAGIDLIFSENVMPVQVVELTGMETRTYTGGQLVLQGSGAQGRVASTTTGASFQVRVFSGTFGTTTDDAVAVAGTSAGVPTAVIDRSGDHGVLVVATVEDCGADYDCGTADDGVTSSFSTPTVQAAITSPAALLRQTDSCTGAALKLCGSVLLGPGLGLAGSSNVREGDVSMNTVVLNPGRAYRVTVPTGVVQDSNGNVNEPGTLMFTPGDACAARTGAVRLQTIRLVTTASVAGAANLNLKDIVAYACGMTVPLRVASAQCLETDGTFADCSVGSEALVDNTDSTAWTVASTAYVLSQAGSVILTLAVDSPAPVTMISVSSGATGTAFPARPFFRATGQTAAGVWDNMFADEAAQSAGKWRYEENLATTAAVTSFRATPAARASVDVLAEQAGLAHVGVGQAGTIYNTSFPGDVMTVGKEQGYANGHKYRVCYCDPQDDTKLEETGDVTFVLRDYTKAANSLDYIPAFAPKYSEEARFLPAHDGLLPKWAAHSCSTKCTRGCSGPHCFCDGFNLLASEEERTALCLPPVLCREACEAHGPQSGEWSDAVQVGAPDGACTGMGANSGSCGRPLRYGRCAGFEVHASSNKCFLLRETPCETAKDAGFVEYLQITTSGWAGVDKQWQGNEIGVLSCDVWIGGLTVDKVEEFDGTSFVPVTQVRATGSPTEGEHFTTQRLFDDSSNPTNKGMLVTTSYAMTNADWAIRLTVKLESPVRVTSLRLHQGYGGVRAVKVAGSVDGVTFSDEREYRGSALTAGLTSEAWETVHWRSSKAGTVENADFGRFELRRGSACTHAADFHDVGELRLTSRAVTDVEYVLQPNSESSLEVTAAPGATLATVYGSTADRVMVIDCSGECGEAPATTSANDLMSVAPVHRFVDQPAEVPNSWTPNTVTLREYALSASSRCSGLDADLATVVTVDNAEVLLMSFQCYSKCHSSTLCVGSHCNCGGFLSGFDSADSKALCVPSESCRQLCNRLTGCTGFDIHKSLPRCFLKIGDCSTASAADDAYDHYDAGAQIACRDDPSCPPTSGTNYLAVSATTGLQKATVHSPDGDISFTGDHFYKKFDPLQFEALTLEIDGVDPPASLSVGLGVQGSQSEVLFAYDLPAAGVATFAIPTFFVGKRAVISTVGLSTGDTDIRAPCLSNNVLGGPTSECSVVIKTGDTVVLGESGDDGTLTGQVRVALLDTTLTGGAVTTVSTVRSRTYQTETSISPVGDYGYSGPQVLRFYPITFTTAGRFKLCLCDSTLTANGHCMRTSDYQIQAGTIHVSGVSCLLENAKFRKFTCCKQHWPPQAASSNLRCYRSMACPTITPQVFFDSFALPARRLSPSAALVTWCTTGPKDITAEHPVCQSLA